MEKVTLLNKIEKFIQEKEYAKARKLIRNDLKRIGSKYDYYFYLGVASDNPIERLKNFEHAFELEPENLEIIINLANAQDENGNYQLAIEGYNKALDMDSKNALVYNNRGYSYYRLGEYEKALQDYNKALSLAPTLKIAQCNKQELAEKLKDNKDFTKILEQSDKDLYDYKYYFNLGIQETNLGNSNEAMTAFNESISLNPDFAPPYMYIGILEFQKENYEKAYEYYTKAINHDAKMIDAYFNRAQIVFGTKTSDKEKLLSALEDLKTAVQLDDKFIDAFYSMAVIYKNLEDYKNSIKALDKILDIDSESVNARALRKLLIKKYLNK